MSDTSSKIGKETNLKPPYCILNTVLLICVSLILTFTNCNSGNKSSSVKVEVKDSVKTIQVKPEQKVPQDSITITIKKDSISKITFLLPSPDEVLSEIFSDKISFNPQLVNSKSNASKYIDTKRLAINLGVYLADFAYLNLNDNKSTALEYFKIVRELTVKVNIYGIFNESIFNRLQNNLTKKDSLNAISREVYTNMQAMLESSKRNNIYALIASGAMIESLYLSVSTVTNYVEYQPIAQKIFEQKYILQNFYEFASQYDNDTALKAVLIQLNTLKKILDNNEIKTTTKKVKKLKKNLVEISGGEEIIVNEKTFEVLKVNVIKIRQDITRVSN